MGNPTFHWLDIPVLDGFATLPDGTRVKSAANVVRVPVSDEIPGFLDVKPLGRGRWRTSEMAVSDIRGLGPGSVIQVGGGEMLRVVAARVAEGFGS